MNKFQYFENPTQVKFLDKNGDDRYIGGIAYQDVIICGECGGIVEISDEYDDYEEEIESGLISVDEVIVPYEYWVNLSEEIKGDD